MNKLGKVVIAATAGFVAGVLLAPKSGKETRKDIKDKAMVLKGTAEDKVATAKKVARQAGKTMNLSADKAKVEAEGMMESARRSGKVVAGEAEKLGNEAKVRAGRVAADAKQTAVQIQKDAEKKLR